MGVTAGPAPHAPPCTAVQCPEWGTQVGYAPTPPGPLPRIPRDPGMLEYVCPPDATLSVPALSQEARNRPHAGTRVRMPLPALCQGPTAEPCAPCPCPGRTPSWADTVLGGHRPGWTHSWVDTLLVGRHRRHCLPMPPGGDSGTIRATPPWTAPHLLEASSPLAHLPGLQPEAQAQLRVVDGAVAPQLCQRQPEVGQGLPEPAGSGAAGGGPQQLQEKGASPAPILLLPPLPPAPGTPAGEQRCSPGSQHTVGTPVPTEGSRGQHADVALTQL